MQSLGDNKDAHSLERNVIACFLSSGIASKGDVFTKSKFKHNNQKQGGGAVN